jgi:predicted MFS family arabinose efflux permease
MDKKQINQMLFLLGFLAFWANGDNYAAAPLIIKIAEDFSVHINQAALTVTSYMLAFGLFTIFFGPLGDRYGKSRIVQIASYGTAVFSCAAAGAFNLGSLILFRGINGAFAAGIFPVTMALIGESFTDQERQNAIGRIMGMMFLGGAAATTIGGAIAYIGSWRLVYLIYGIAELILAVVLSFKLVRSPAVISRLSFATTYGKAFRTPGLLFGTGLIFLVGYSVFGSFTFTGKFVELRTGYSILWVGIILSCFGLGTVIGGRRIGVVRAKIGRSFLPLAGAVGAAALVVLSLSAHPALLAVLLFLFGLSFVSLQSTLIMTVQGTLPAMRGTAMSLASLNMFVGGAVGTLVNRCINQNFGLGTIYPIAAAVLFATALGAAWLVSRIMRMKRGPAA